MTQVSLTSGMIQGTADGRVRRYLGVPYAASPTGDLRFAKPQAYPAWPGVRDATAQGPIAPQPLPPDLDLGMDMEPLIGPTWDKGNDFLNLNIWAPDKAAIGLPVMVYIHGGSFIAGSNGSPILDGSAFARSGVICMSMNYRMGVEGFVPIAGAPTNLGLRDMIFALEWIRDNAAAFGGDPANVTIFGESAGAMAVGDLLAAPAATGLFRRAIVQSGHGQMVRTISVTERLTRKLAKMLKVKPDLKGFRSTTVEQCVKALEKVQVPTSGPDLRDAQKREPSFGLSKFLPLYGDDVLPQKPLDALASGASHDVDLLIGNNRDELNLYLVPMGAGKKINKLLAWLALGRIWPHAGAMMKTYGGQGKKGGEILGDILTDMVFRWPSRVYAAAHRGRTHVYEFGWRSPALNDELGASHGLELPFVFNTLQDCSGERGFVGPNPPQALADHIHGLWVQFASDGTLPWPEFTTDSRQVYRLEEGRAIAEPEMPAKRFW